MARPRDYAAEQQARNARARSEGYNSYWDKRQADAYVRGLSSDERHAARARAARQGITGASTRDLIKGQQMMRNKQIADANRLARKLGARGSRDSSSDFQHQPLRLFFYH